MTPQEKAKDLVDRFYLYSTAPTHNPEMAKQCALIAVDEILTAITFNMYDEDAYNKEHNYWQEVKTEIEQL